MIDFSQFSGEPAPGPERWLFFAPPQFDALPPEHQDQLFFLDAASTEAAYKAAVVHEVTCGDVWGNDPFAGGCYRSVERAPLRELPRPRMEALKKWLYRRGVPFRREVLLLPVFAARTTPVVRSTWKMVVTYADVFFGSDNLVVTGASTDWCLYYHHDDVFTFARGRQWGPRGDQGRRSVTT